MEKYGYHITKISRGILGESSKIQEELDELIDAEKQENKILALCELADIIGSIDAYINKNYTNITIQDLYIMAIATKRAFLCGER